MYERVDSCPQKWFCFLVFSNSIRLHNSAFSVFFSFNIQVHCTSCIKITSCIFYQF